MEWAKRYRQRLGRLSPFIIQDPLYTLFIRGLSCSKQRKATEARLLAPRTFPTAQLRHKYSAISQKPVHLWVAYLNPRTNSMIQIKQFELLAPQLQIHPSIPFGHLSGQALKRDLQHKDAAPLIYAASIGDQVRVRIGKPSKPHFGLIFLSSTLGLSCPEKGVESTAR